MAADVQKSTPLAALEWLYKDIMTLLGQTFEVVGDSRRLYSSVSPLPTEEINRLHFRWAPELSKVMEQFLLDNHEFSRVNLSYELMRKNRPALYQEVVIEMLRPGTDQLLRDAMTEYCYRLRELNDEFHVKLHAAFELRSAQWWEEIDESPELLGEYIPYFDALCLAFNEAYINFDILEQVLAAIRRVLR